MNLNRRYPLTWRTSVVVLRHGGRDKFGNPKEPEEIPVTDCLVAPRGTTEPAERSDLAESDAVLYRTIPDGFQFLNTDRVVIPDGERMAGTWSVDGLPSEWPLGVEVPLKRT